MDKGDDDNKDAVGEVAMVDLLKENDDKAETALDNDRDMLEDMLTDMDGKDVEEIYDYLKEILQLGLQNRCYSVLLL